MWWIVSAVAGDLVVSETYALPSPATQVTAADSDWLVVGPDGSFLVDASGAEALGTEPTVAAGVADLEADGEVDPLVCGRDGLWFTSRAGELWIADGACTGLAVHSDG